MATGAKPFNVGRESQTQLVGADQHLNGPDNPLSALSAARPLSREGVPALHSVIATGLTSRHRSEFGTLEHCRFAGLRPAARAILGALKCLQNGI